MDQKGRHENVNETIFKRICYLVDTENTRFDTFESVFVGRLVSPYREYTHCTLFFYWDPDRSCLKF